MYVCVLLSPSLLSWNCFCPTLPTRDKRTNMVKLETRIPAGFIGGLTALIPQVRALQSVCVGGCPRVGCTGDTASGWHLCCTSVQHAECLSQATLLATIHLSTPYLFPLSLCRLLV